MNFKDAVAADIDNVFFKTNEFAESVNIDGKPVPLILDDDMLQGKTETYAEGLANGEQFIFIKQKDIKRIPQPGDELSKENKKWYVREVISEMGVLAIRIGRNKANG